MTLSPTVAELVAAYEQEHGRKSTELAVQVLEHIAKVGDMLHQLGQKDAQKGDNARPVDVFPLLVVKAFQMDADEDQDIVEGVADLWYSEYMDGYNVCA